MAARDIVSRKKKKTVQRKTYDLRLGDVIVDAALRIDDIQPTSYALQEYGLSEAEMSAAENRIERDVKSARARREVASF